MKQHFDSDYDEVYQFELLEDFMKLYSLAWPDPFRAGRLSSLIDNALRKRVWPRETNEVGLQQKPSYS